MLSDDVEMLMCHCRNSLSANGELLGAITRIKTALAEGQKPPTNSAMDAIALINTYRAYFPNSDSLGDFKFWLETISGQQHQ